MSCSITNDVKEWTIENKNLTKFYKLLYSKIEHGGKFSLDTHSKKISDNIKSNSGQKDSVSAPDAIINWHTHPINCYFNEKTIFGWPSGEDLRETLIFGLRGSACHLVPAVEGIYIIQPNPCIITNLINLEIPREKYKKLANIIPEEDWYSFIRGYIILAIEIYFRSSHVFRTVEYLSKYSNTTAYDFINFVNSFELGNMFHKNKIEGCGNISCNQIQQYENKRVEQIKLIDYVKNYENNTFIYTVDRHGKTKNTKYLFKDILKIDNKLLENITLVNDCLLPIKEWHSEKPFFVRLFPNEILINNEWIDYNILSKEIQWEIIKSKKPSIRLKDDCIKFYMFDMRGDCEHEDLKNHLHNFSTIVKKIEIYGSDKCKYCINASNKLGKKAKLHYYDDIKTAIEKASKRAGHDVKTIPAFFINGKYVKDYHSFLTNT